MNRLALFASCFLNRFSRRSVPVGNRATAFSVSSSVHARTVHTSLPVYDVSSTL